MKSKRYLGLDIGASGVKAVVLRSNGKQTELEAVDELRTLEEGILNEQELYGSIAQRLAGKKWSSLPTVIGLPQYLAQTMLKDFPVIQSTAKMDALVNSEISQVAGLSEESLIHDYCQLYAGAGRKNGFLIGLCREQTIRERLTSYELAGIRTDGMALGGLAVANAYLQLKAGDISQVGEEKPVLLLDLGRENAVAVVMAGKMPLYVSSLMFSGEKFEQAVKSQANGARGSYTAAKSVSEVNLMEEVGTSPVILAASLLESEIQGAVESWRAQEDFGIGKAPIVKVLVCGGVARMKGLCEWLSEHLETPVEIFGPDVEGMIRPELVQAYGLALQCAGDSATPIQLSLVPADIRWRKLREENWRYLAAALGVLIGTMLFLDIFWYVRASSLIASFSEQSEELDRCNNLVSRIESAQNALYDREAKIIPLVEAGSQPVRIRHALEELGKACAENDWIVYLADEASYQRAKSGDKSDDRRGNRSAGDMFGSDSGGTSGTPEFPWKMLPQEMPVTSRYITAAYSPLVKSQPYAAASEMAKKLNDGKIFKGVDLLDGKESFGREDIFVPWDNWLKRDVRGQFKRYFFALPFADQDVRKEFLPPPEAKGKSKKKKG